MIRKYSIVLAVCLMASGAHAADAPVFSTNKEKVSYTVGVEVARNFKQQGIEVEVDALLQGLRDELTGNQLALSENDLRATSSAFQSDLIQKRAKARKLAAMDNKAAGDAFLAENGKKNGVVTLPDGLQYRILKEGEGEKPKDTDTVECNYRGTLIDGTEFDSSYDKGQPATFKLDGLIAGWKEALKLMPTGSKWQLFIPSELAYGQQGSGRYIGPNATLIFEVELLAVK